MTDLHNGWAQTGLQQALGLIRPALRSSYQQLVRVPHRTKLRCTPKPRCLPLHSRHMNMPYDTEAHCGFLVLQSTHTCRSRQQLAQEAKLNMLA